MGTGYGACEGEVTPQQEDCKTAADEDCDHLTPPCMETLLWANHYGSTADQAGQGIALDHSGHTVIVGWFHGGIDFGGGSFASLTNDSGFVASFGADGQHVWSRAFGFNTSHAYAVAADSSDNVIVAGSFSGMVDFGCGTLTSQGNQDIFVAKYDVTGACKWSQRFGGPGDQIAYGVAGDAMGNIVLAGVTSGSAVFGTTTLTSSGTQDQDAFVAKLDQSGTPQWAKRFGDPAAQFAASVAVTPDGNSIVVVGSVSGSATIDGKNIVSAGGQDAFVVAFDGGGNAQWVKRAGDEGDPSNPTDQWASAVALDADGSVIVAGAYEGTINLGAGLAASKGGKDVFVAKYTSAGSALWNKSYGDSADQVAFGVAVDSLKDVFVAGGMQGTVNFGGGALASMGGDDIFLVKLDASGAHVWSDRFGDAGDQRALAVAADSAGSVAITGTLASTADFGKGPLTSTGGTDVFVALFAP
jgi:hypothetical protein